MLTKVKFHANKFEVFKGLDRLLQVPENILIKSSFFEKKT